MITNDDFCTVLQGLARNLPRQKSLDAMALTLAWVTFPALAKEKLTRDVWVYAAAQRMLDPSPLTDDSLHIQLLIYVFRNENGKPRVDWGLKVDLPDRMSKAHLFHPQPTPGMLSNVKGEIEASTPNGVLAGAPRYS